LAILLILIACSSGAIVLLRRVREEMFTDCSLE
jgi:hypothetical protein